VNKLTPFRPIQAKQYLRKMRGGSQSCLIRAEDDNLYVIKMLGNPQGSQILFHEALGTQLMGHIGLPVPAWSLIELTAEFIESNPESWFDIGASRRYRPIAGLHFGSKLAVADSTAYEFLPAKWLAQVVNRSDFVGALLFDLWCSHRDRRQAVFIPGTGRDLEAVFIDQGALFSDAKIPTSRANLCAMYWDPEVYAGLDVGDLLPFWESRIQAFDLVKFEKEFCAIGLPAEWYTPATAPDILSKLKRRQKSLGRLSSSIREALNSVSRQMSGTSAWSQQRETIQVCGLRM
jgi:hypothetical protein